MKSTSSSIRISNELALRLQQAAIQQKRAKNSIIVQAMEEYLSNIDRRQFLEEARRQSVLASAAVTEDEEVWLKHADTSGWT